MIVHGAVEEVEVDDETEPNIRIGITVDRVEKLVSSYEEIDGASKPNVKSILGKIVKRASEVQ